MHFGAGVLILGFVAWRLALRFTRGVPKAPAGDTPLLQRGAAWGHGLLYAIMVAAAVSGLIAWFGGGIEAVAEVHKLAKAVIIVLVLGHVAMALWHHYWRKDGLLTRMIRPQD